MIDAPAAWEASTGEGVIVAVIDTGIDTNHQDLDDNINFIDGYDFISDDTSANDDEPGVDSNPHDTGTFFHGSHVSGIIAAEGNNNIGVAGVAYNATIMPLRVLGVDNKGSNSDIANAILYAAGIADANGLKPEKKADIINLSLGGTDFSELLQDAINAALEQGVIIIAAAGNDSSEVPHYPAAFDGVIAVSAVNDHKTLSSFSNYGDHIAVTAPGGTGSNNTLLDGFQDGVLSTLFANEYAEFSGTSMATPHVAAVAALMKSINADLDKTSFAGALKSGYLTDNLSNPHLYGDGLINAAKAVNWALTSQGENLLSTSLSIFPTQLGFAGANTKTTLELSNPGTGSLTITDISTDSDWIEINKSIADNTGQGDYPITVNNTDLAVNSVNSGEVLIEYSINGEPQDTISINVFNSNIQQSDATVGTLLVSLSYIDINASENPLVQFALVEALKGDGQYNYQFHNIPNGEYLLHAGTNSDLDFDILDYGEARGQYPPFTQTEFIKVYNENLSVLEFSLQYQSFAQPSALTTQETSTNKSIGSTEKFR
jgi:serine protease